MGLPVVPGQTVAAEQITDCQRLKSLSYSVKIREAWKHTLIIEGVTYDSGAWPAWVGGWVGGQAAIVERLVSTWGDEGKVRRWWDDQATLI